MAGLENYTFLTSGSMVLRPNVYAGRRGQILKGFSNVCQNHPLTPHSPLGDASQPTATQGNHIWVTLSELPQTLRPLSLERREH